MSRKTSNNHFYPKKLYRLVASRQIEIPFIGGIGRQRGRGFGALAQVFEKTEIPFLRQYIARL